MVFILLINTLFRHKAANAGPRTPKPRNQRFAPDRFVEKGGIGLVLFSWSVLPFDEEGRYWRSCVFIVGAVLVLPCFHCRWSHFVEKGGIGFAVFSSSVVPFG